MSRNNFVITFTGEFLDDDPTMAVGLIQLGEFRESFCATLEYWTIKDYEESWNKALLRLTNGAATSCLITSFIDPLNANFLILWPLYRFGDEVAVQNQLLFSDQLSHVFDPTAPWESIHPYSAIDGDGRNISEWRIQMTDLREFLGL